MENAPRTQQLRLSRGIALDASATLYIHSDLEISDHLRPPSGMSMNITTSQFLVLKEES